MNEVMNNIVNDRKGDIIVNDKEQLCPYARRHTSCKQFMDILPIREVVDAYALNLGDAWSNT